MSPLYREQLLRYKPDLILIAEAGEEDEYFDLISYLPLA